jgi:hypothetical protein
MIRMARDLRAKYAGQLEELAAWCDQQGLRDEAAKTRAWLGVRDPNKLYIVELPESVGPAPLPEGAATGTVEWNQRFLQLRHQQAVALETLARRAVRGDRSSLAFDLVLAAIREDPDYEKIRRLLGFKKLSDSWRTLYEIDHLQAKQVWHEKFGWIAKANVRRYEQDERLYQGRWISAEEDARLHRDIRSGWDVETEHYTIRTNHSLEAGVALGVKLEQLYRVWKQLFIRYFATEAQVRELFDGRPRKRTQLPRHQVMYFRDKDDYFRALKPEFANIEQSIGIYIGAPRCAYFFAGEGHDERTLYHEATHQLFHESRPVAPDVGLRTNFWIVEGIAMYMESLHREEGFHVLGGLQDIRVQAARYRLLKEGFYVPLEQLSGMGIHAIQNDKRIVQLYGQAAALTHFLIHYDGGRYRDALVSYLSDVYSGRDHLQTLPQKTGATFTDLDAQFRQFMTSGGEPPAEKKKPAGP